MKGPDHRGNSGAPPAPWDGAQDAVRKAGWGPGDEPQRSEPPRARRPSGLPLGRASSLSALVCVPSRTPASGLLESIPAQRATHREPLGGLAPGKEASEGRCWRPSDERADAARRADGPGPPWPGRAVSKDGAGPGVLRTAAGPRSSMGSLLGPHPYVRTPPGARGGRRMALLASLGRRQAHSLPSAGRPGARTAKDLWRDACAPGCAARSGEEADVGRIGDETRHRRAPGPRRPSGLPPGRASSVSALVCVPSRTPASGLRESAPARGATRREPLAARAPTLLARRRARGRALFTDRP